jgi:hypothetical protein
MMTEYLLDSLMGNKIAYSMTRNEAAEFIVAIVEKHLIKPRSIAALHIFLIPSVPTEVGD